MDKFRTYQITVDTELNIIDHGEDFEKYTGHPDVHNLEELIPPQDFILLKNSLFAVNPGSLGLCCFRILTKDGSLNWIAANSEKPDPWKGIIYMELSDIQSLKADSSQARVDHMTGLLNKQAIISYAQELVNAYPRKSFYFFLMDIDHFKSVNDTFGHMKGDAVIIDVAHILRDTVGDKGVVGRIGGDEFMIVFEKINKEPQLRQVLRTVRDTVKEKYEKMGNNISITVSFGGALYPDYTPDYDSLFKLADKMLYIAKVKGRDRYIIYTPSVHGKVDDEVKVATVSHRAAAENDKTRLILDLLTEHSTANKAFDVKEALAQVLEAYDLDELYILDGETGESTYGLMRSSGSEDGNIESAQKSLPILVAEESKSLFDSNGMAAINIFDLRKETHEELIAYMEANRYRVIAAYRMSQEASGKYLVYVNRSDSSCRLSETDLSDLTYFAHLVELSETQI